MKVFFEQFSHTYVVTLGIDKGFYLKKAGKIGRKSLSISLKFHGLLTRKWEDFSQGMGRRTDKGTTKKKITFLSELKNSKCSFSLKLRLP